MVSIFKIDSASRDLIPPESLTTFLEIVLSTDDWKQYDDINELGEKIIQAKNENKYMIHYGI